MTNLLITGMSGAGKSTGMNALEDLGYYCIDNLPIDFLEDLLSRFSSDPSIKGLAIAVDSRSLNFFQNYPKVIGELKAKHKLRILYFTASTEVIVRRFSETRRKHPCPDTDTLLDAIHRERDFFTAMNEVSDKIIDTTSFHSHDLRRLLFQHFAESTRRERLHLNFISFGYKYRVPVDVELVIDVRFLPNPYYVLELKHKTGLDEDVRNFVLSAPECDLFVKKTKDFLDFLLPQYEREGKIYLNVGFGCTGGRHRSVALAEHLKSLYEQDYVASVSHRHVDRGFTPL